jgi:hypothetical protein
VHVPDSKQQKQQAGCDKDKMTAIQLSAGRKHTIKVGDKVQEVTLRPGEVRYLPFIRAVMAIPKVEPVERPQKVKPLVSVTPPSRARPEPTFDDIIALVEGVRGRRDLGFKPTVDNLISSLKKFRK